MADPMTLNSVTIAVLRSLPARVRERRAAHGISIRQAGREMGVCFSTVSRLENGEDLALSTAIAALRWLDSEQSL